MADEAQQLQAFAERVHTEGCGEACLFHHRGDKGSPGMSDLHAGQTESLAQLVPNLQAQPNQTEIQG